MAVWQPRSAARIAAKAGDHRLARADVALQQSHHGPLVRQILEHFPRCPGLGSCQAETKLFEQLPPESRPGGQRDGGLALQERLAPLHDQVVTGEFVENDAFAGGLDAILIVARGVEEPNRRHEFGELHIGQGAGEGAIATLEGGVHPLADSCRRQPERGGIHGRQFGLRGRRLRAVQTVFGMHHFQPGRSDAHVPETSHPGAWLHGTFLAAREVEQPHGQRAAPVAEAAKQRPAPAEVDVRRHDLAGDQALLPRFQLVERHRPRPVLVAVREVQHQVAQRGDAESLEFLRSTGTDARQVGHGGAGGLVAAGRGHQSGRTSTPSISTRAPRGNAATWTAARAG